MLVLRRRNSRVFVSIVFLCVLFLLLFRPFTSTPYERATRSWQEHWKHLRGIPMSSLVEPTVDALMITPNTARITGTPKLKAVVFVCSEPTSFKKRKAIRKSWARHKYKASVEVLFFMGNINNASVNKMLVEEGTKFEDLVQDNLPETYWHLPAKVLRMMKLYLTWVDKESLTSSSVPMFVKVDEDVALNLDRFLSSIDTSTQALYRSKLRSAPRGFIAGRIVTKSKVYRKKLTRFYMPYSVYWSPMYPRYIMGGVYAIDGHVVEDIYRAALQFEYFPFEDVFITGIVAHQLLDIKQLHLPRIYSNKKCRNITASQLRNFVANEWHCK